MSVACCLLNQSVVLVFCVLANQQPVPLVYPLNTTTRMPFEILFIILIGAIVFPFTLEFSVWMKMEERILVVVFS